MTRKEALAVLYRFWDVYWRQETPMKEPPRQQTERQEIESTAYHALLVLTDAVHKKAPSDRSRYLCDVCHLRYTDGYLYEDEHGQELGGLCEPCKAARKAQGLPTREGTAL